jgi:hypothetical protein
MLKPAAVFSAEGKLNTKLSRHKDCLRLLSNQKVYDDDSPDAINESYITKSTKEELCIEYIHSFLSQFEQIYMQDLPKNTRKSKINPVAKPPRKAPYMLAANEYGNRLSHIPIKVIVSLN